MGFPAPKEIMTTDMLVTKKDGSEVAYSVKPNKDLRRRNLQLLCIEKQYWMNQGKECRLVFKTEMNTILASNIRLVTEFYDLSRVFDKISAIKHKIATKEYQIDMEHELLDERMLLNLLGEQ